MACCNWCIIKVVSVVDLGESDVSTSCMGRYHPAYKGGWWCCFNQAGHVSSCEKCLCTQKKKQKKRKCVRRVCECNNVSSIWGKCIWLSQQCSWQHEEYNKAYKYPVWAREVYLFDSVLSSNADIKSVEDCTGDHMEGIVVTNLPLYF